MQSALDEEYLTVGQAASLLQVDRSTIRRWIARDLLPAYRVGPRRIALRRADVARLLAPMQAAGTGRAATAQGTAAPIGPLTPEEQQRALEAVEALERLQRELDAKYGRAFTTPSWKLLQAARRELR